MLPMRTKTFYLFYTGFTGGDLSTRHLGLAKAEKPWGPWERCGDSPVLYHGSEDSDWHSDMVGDSNYFFEKVNGGSISKERNPTRSHGKPTLVLQCQMRSKVHMRYIRPHPYLMDTHFPLGNTEAALPLSEENIGQRYCGRRMGWIL